jgi:hypothetical protein
MWSFLVCVSLLVLALAATAAMSQPGLMDPAYRHFLNSPYSYRAFSALRPGYAETRVTPFGRDSVFVEPSRLHQRITPWGFESYETLPGHGRSVLDPWGYGGYYVPGDTRSYFLPGVGPRPAPSAPPPSSSPRTTPW